MTETNHQTPQTQAELKPHLKATLLEVLHDSGHLTQDYAERLETSRRAAGGRLRKLVQLGLVTRSESIGDEANSGRVNAVWVAEWTPAVLQGLGLGSLTQEQARALADSLLSENGSSLEDVKTAWILGREAEVAKVREDAPFLRQLRNGCGHELVAILAQYSVDMIEDILMCFPSAPVETSQEDAFEKAMVENDYANSRGSCEYGPDCDGTRCKESKSQEDTATAAEYSGYRREREILAACQESSHQLSAMGSLAVDVRALLHAVGNYADGSKEGTSEILAALSDIALWVRVETEYEPLQEISERLQRASRVL